jgi:hypothetical protein
MQDNRDARSPDGDAILQAHHLPAASSFRWIRLEQAQMALPAMNADITPAMINAAARSRDQNMNKPADKVHPA